MMAPAEKRVTWRRITMEATAWRFNKYAERAREGQAVASPIAEGSGTESRETR